MKTVKRTLHLTVLATSALALVPSLHAATTLLSQDFNTGHTVNYTGTFVNHATNLSYYNLFSAAPALKIDRFTNTTGDYVTIHDADNGAGFTNTLPAVMDFTVAKGTGLTGYTFSLSMAGAPGAEDFNFFRAFSDNDGDGIFETALFNFTGTTDSAYTNSLNPAQALSLAFQTFSYNLATPTGPNVNIRLQLFPDSSGNNEVLGFDNIVISAIPEPSTALLGAIGTLALLRRRRGA